MASICVCSMGLWFLSTSFLQMGGGAAAGVRRGLAWRRRYGAARFASAGCGKGHGIVGRGLGARLEAAGEGQHGVRKGGEGSGAGQAASWFRCWTACAWKVWSRPCRCLRARGKMRLPRSSQGLLGASSPRAASSGKAPCGVWG